MVGEWPVVFLYIFWLCLWGLWTFGFVRLKIVFWVLFVELGDLLTPSVTRLSLATSCLVETLTASSPSDRAQVTCSSPSVRLSPSTLGLSTPGYSAVSRITRNFLIVVVKFLLSVLFRFFVLLIVETTLGVLFLTKPREQNHHYIRSDNRHFKPHK